MTAKFTIEDDATVDPKKLYLGFCERLFAIAEALHEQKMDTLDLAGAYLATGLRILVPELGHQRAVAYLRDLAQQLEVDALAHAQEVH